MKTAFLFLTDKHSDKVLDNFRFFNTAIATMGDAFLLYHHKTEVLPRSLDHTAIFPFTYISLTDLGYWPISEKLIPGNNHFPLFQFFCAYPGYDYYWCIEDDVRFNGNWQTFFGCFHRQDHDFITCHIRMYEEEPAWYWWKSFWHPAHSIPMAYLLRSFNPIYRISAAAMGFLHQALSDHWIGHHEVLLPTLLYHNHFRIADFGGAGKFVPHDMKNRWYTDGDPDSEGNLSEGTMRFRPAHYAAGPEADKLYHPVKDAEFLPTK